MNWMNWVFYILKTALLISKELVNREKYEPVAIDKIAVDAKFSKGIKNT